MTIKDFAKDIYEMVMSEEGQRLQEELFQRIKRERVEPDRETVDNIMQDLKKIVKLSYIAERFFGKSKSWLSHKINHDMINGKPEEFTPEERIILKDALSDLSDELQDMSAKL